ncbi:MAG: YwaF family protein [Planctomycetaceae bacterium]
MAILARVLPYAALALFHFEHLCALVATGAACAALAAWGRRSAGTRLPRGLALFLVATELARQASLLATGAWEVTSCLPLELCDIGLATCAVALWSRRQGPFEFAYFWGLSGTLQAVLTPDLRASFPDPTCVGYFLQHSGIVAGVMLLTTGYGMRPRRGATRRVFLWTLVYAVAIGLLDWALGANYFYLRRKPAGGSILDLFPDWPLYIPCGAAIGALLFFLLDLPFARRRPT